MPIKLEPDDGDVEKFYKETEDFIKWLKDFITLKQIQKNSEDRFRKEFDELGLKPSKNSMPNLERELIIDFWRKEITKAKQETATAILEEVEKVFAYSIVVNKEEVEVISKDDIKTFITNLIT